jgi:hypothetical protein
MSSEPEPPSTSPVMVDPTYTGTKRSGSDGRDVHAEVVVRFLPCRSAGGVGFSSNASRSMLALEEPGGIRYSHALWRVIKAAMDARAKRQRHRPNVVGHSFRANVVSVQATGEATPEHLDALISEAGRVAAEQYFADLDAGRVRPTPEDSERPFAYLPSTGFDEEFISRRPCFLEYVAEWRPGFLLGYGVAREHSIETARRERTLSHAGRFYFNDAIRGYLCGCRPEADALVAQSHDFLTLAESLKENPSNGDPIEWTRARRQTALAYLHWLRTGEPDEETLARARQANLEYYQREKFFVRAIANLVAPELLYLGAESVLNAMAERLAAKPGRGAWPPGGLFGDALRIVNAPDEKERERLRLKLRKRMPLHLFRWMNRGHYGDVAFILHALFPRPEGPPSRLIERAWDFMPEIERRRELSFGWDIVKKPG